MEVDSSLIAGINFVILASGKVPWNDEDTVVYCVCSFKGML